MGYEGRYEISNLGRLYCLGAESQWSRWRHYTGGIVKGTKIKKGYRQYCLTKDGREHSVQAHILVAESFLGPRPPGRYVCHSDGDGDNNALENLRYATPKENQADSERHGTRKTRANGHHNAKLTINDVRAIKASSLLGVELARRYGVAPQTICGIRKG